MKARIEVQIPVYLNRAQLIDALGVKQRAFYAKTKIQPDAVDGKRAPLFLASRVAEIMQQLRKPEVIL